MSKLNQSSRIRRRLGRIAKLSIFSLILAALCLSPIPAETFATFPFQITARSALLMDLDTARIIRSKAAYTKYPPASTAKVLTALVVADHLGLNEILTASSRAAGKPSTKIFVRRGERFYVKDLLRALLIASANDAAVVLAEGVSGSESQFARSMNRKARQLGAKNSNFINASGLPAEGQFSTAYDLALFVRAASRNRFLMETMKTRTMSIQSLNGRRIKLKNHNKMMWRDPRPIYGKTGWTRRSRHCFAGRIVHHKKDVCVVTMGSVKPWSDLKKLADYTFGHKVSNQASQGGTKSRASVKSIQRALRQAGFDPGPVDGRLGSRTTKAVKAFQRAHGLKPDGIVGFITLSKLERYTPRGQNL